MIQREVVSRAGGGLFIHQNATAVNPSRAVPEKSFTNSLGM